MSLIDISSINSKVSNEGATEEGILTSENWNLLVKAVEELQDVTTTETSDRKEADKTLKENLNAVVGTLDVGTLDSVPASVGDGLAMAKDALHTRWTLTSDGTNVGVIDMFSDSMKHQLTQVLTTHCTMNGGTLDFSTHNDTAVYRYYRSYNMGSAHLTNDVGTWTAWQEELPLTIVSAMSLISGKADKTQSAVNTLQSDYAAFKATKGQAHGLAPLDEDGLVGEEYLPVRKQVVAFDGMVSGVTVTLGSTATPTGVVYEKSLKKFVAYVQESQMSMKRTYYANWAERKVYQDVDTDVPYKERLYVDTAGQAVYAWDGTELKRMGGNRQVALTQDEYDALVAAGIVDENTYYNILEDE